MKRKFIGICGFFDFQSDSDVVEGDGENEDLLAIDYCKNTVICSSTKHDDVKLWCFNYSNSILDIRQVFIE